MSRTTCRPYGLAPAGAFAATADDDAAAAAAAAAAAEVPRDAAAAEDAAVIAEEKEEEEDEEEEDVVVDADGGLGFDGSGVSPSNAPRWPGVINCLPPPRPR